MISQTVCGLYWNHIYPEDPVPGAGLHRIIASLSMPFFGFYGLVLPGGIYPPDYGDWKNTHRRFCRWRDKGIWERLLETLIDEPDYEWLMIDASHIKVHPHATGALGGNQAIGRTKGGSIRRYIWPWMRMVCQSECLLQQVPQRIVAMRGN